MNALLQVENEKGVEVCFKPSLQECFIAKDAHAAPTSNLTSVTITSYSKDENVLNGSIAKTRIQITSVPKGFCQYLFDRKKAGVIKFCDIILYVLPPKSRNDSTLLCISPSVPVAALNHLEQNTLLPVLGTSNPGSTSFIRPSTSSSSSASTAKSSSESAVDNKTAVAAGGKGGDDFFSSLLNKVRLTPSFEISIIEGYYFLSIILTINF